VVWVVITLLSLALFLAGIPGRFEQLVTSVDRRSLFELGLSTNVYAGYIIALNFTVIMVHALIAAVIFWRRPDDWMALFVSYSLVTNGALIPLSLMNTVEVVPLLWQFLAGLVTYVGLVCSITILYLFPNGRFVPAWTRLLAIGWALLVFFAIFWPHSALSFSSLALPAQLLVLLLWSGTGIFAQVYRFENVSNPLQRQQTKWALLGLIAAISGPFAYFLPFVILPSINGPVIPNILYQRVGSSFFAFSFLVRLSSLTVVTFVLLLFPLLFAIAILRFRLWDIDLLIRRTLIYAALTVALALVYFGIVVLFQAIFRTATSEGQSVLATVVSTLVIAALFNPLRQRVQDLIDRRFYRHKYDAEQTLVAFSAMVRDEVDLNRLSEVLVGVVEETMQPAHASLWLREQEG
jgi:hypothetical protein